jgi:molecular chaperone GrpE
MVVMEQDDIEEIRKKAERFESQYNKLKQEFKDYIETSRRNEETKRQELKKESAKKLLVVADSLGRISASNNISCDIVKSYSENLKKNVDVIYSQLLSVSGLTPIEPVAGDKFDDKMHMAIGLEYGTVYPENSVFRVIRKGYRIENNIVRPAEVIISKRPIEVIKVTKPGLRDRILRWINPAKLRYAKINHRIDELERAQKEDIGKLTQDISSLKNTITQLEARDKKVSELESVRKEKIERLIQDIAELKNTIIELEVKNKKITEFERIQEEKIEKLTQNISSLKNIIIELEEKISSEEKAPLQGGDISDNSGQSQGI